MYQLDPFTRLISGLITTELHGLEVHCCESHLIMSCSILHLTTLILLEPASKEFSIFNPPSGQQCLQYAQSYINSVGGYINNTDATSACQYCPYRVGDDFYKPIGILFSNRWRDLGIFIAFVVFNIFVVSDYGNAVFFPSGPCGCSLEEC